MATTIWNVRPASDLTPPAGGMPPAYCPTSRNEPGEEAITAFERDGVVCLRNVLSAHEVELLREGADRSAEQPGPLSHIVGHPGAPGFFYYDFQLHERIPAFRWLVFDSRVPDLAAQLMRSRGVTLYYSNLFVKDAGSKVPSPWHEDASYQRMNGLEVINFWVSLDRIPAATTLIFKRGSHRRPGPIFQGSHFDPAITYTRPLTRNRGPMPSMDKIDSGWPSIWWELEPGDALVFTQRTLHAAPANTLPVRRRAAAVLLLGDGATYNADPGDSDPGFRDDTIADGAHPAGFVFPRLR